MLNTFSTLQKTWRCYIDGSFIPASSTDSYPLVSREGALVTSVPAVDSGWLKSALSASDSGHKKWVSMQARERGELLLRWAENLQLMKPLLISQLQEGEVHEDVAEQEVERSIERLVYYAGWCDKYSAAAVTESISTNTNSVETHYRPKGRVLITTPQHPYLLSAISMMAPALAGGNGVTVILSEEDPRPALLAMEAAAGLGFPAGLINMVSGERSTLLHNEKLGNLPFDVLFTDDDTDEKHLNLPFKQQLRKKQIPLKLISNVDWIGRQMDHLYHILDFQRAVLLDS